MKHLKISISKHQTLCDVEKTTAYQAVKNEAAARLYERVAVVKADHSLLESFWHDCRAIADHTLQEYRRHPMAGIPPSVSVTEFDHASATQDDDYHAFLLMPGNWDEMLVPTVKTSLHAFFVAYMVARWMALVWPEAASVHSALATTHLDQVKCCLEARIRQPRPKTIENHEYEEKDDNSGHPSVETADDL